MAAYNLTHNFLFRSSPQLGFFTEAVFADIYSLSQLEKRLEAVAFPDDPDHLNGFDPYADVLGDGWELFSEFLQRAYGLTKPLGITDVVVCAPGTPGIDFYGIGLNGKAATSQSKYKGLSKAWKMELAEGPDMHLERCLAQSQNVWGVDSNDTENIILITNAVGVKYYTNDTLLFKKVKCFGRPQIEKVTKNNPAFWNSLRESISVANPHITF